MTRIQSQIINGLLHGSSEIIRHTYPNKKPVSTIVYYDGKLTKQITEKTFQAIKNEISNCLEYTETVYSNWRDRG